MDLDFLDCFGRKKNWAYIPKKHFAAYPYSARKGGKILCLQDLKMFCRVISY